MERLRKARTPVRAAISRTVSELEADIAMPDIDKTVVEAKVIKLEKLMEEVTGLNDKIKELLLDEDTSDEAYARELGINEEYDDKASVTILRVQKVLNPPLRPGSPSISGTSSLGDSDKKRNFKLPKIELKKFRGEPMEWLGWWAQFSKIHEDETLHVTDKFQYLCQATVEGSRARKLVETYPQSADNYPKVIKALTERFGDEVILSEVYVRQLLKMVLLNNNAGKRGPLAELYDELHSHVQALETLGIASSQSAVFLYPLVESSLPEEIVKVWQRSPLSGYDTGVVKKPDERLHALMQFLKSEVKGAERLFYVRAGLEEPKSTEKMNAKYSNKKREDVPTVASLHVGQREACIFCQKTNHSSAVCFKAKNMSFDERKNAVKASHSCFACLRKGHSFKTCRSQIKCMSCGRKHYMIMCPGDASQSQTSQDEVQRAAASDESVKVTTTYTSGTSRGATVLLKTIRVWVQGSTGKRVQARLLFDEGSQQSYIQTSIAEELRCPVLEEFVQQNHLFGGFLSGCTPRKLHKVIVKKLNGSDQREMSLVNDDVICASCPTIPPGPWMKELARAKIYVNDTLGEETDDIQILIGSDLREKYMTGRKYELQCGLVAVESVFGWTLCGRLPHRDISCASIVINMLVSEEKSLPKLWELETLGIKDPVEKMSEEEHDEHVRRNLQCTMTRDAEGRYIVNLPWKSDTMELPSNRGVAEKRLMSVTEKLKRQDNFKCYDQVFKDWEKEQLIETDMRNETLKQHFLPHRPVLKPESTTTPVRPVFDASCRVGKGPSLNQCLEKGPNMLQLIPSIIHRFRRSNIGIVADIRKAFQMVGVAEQDRKFQKFLWWDGDAMQEYRHCRVVFGMNCSPFILAAVLDYHLTNVPAQDKEIADLLKKSLYVDNCLVSLDTTEDYFNFKKRSISLLAEAKMDLRQWESNCDEPEGNEPVNVLGLKWDKKKDCLFCQPPDIKQELIVNKRNVLSITAQVFDPIGFTSPAILQPKLMLQDSWSAKLGWDEEWKPEQGNVFRKWYAELPRLKFIRIPRKAFGTGPEVEYQLHTFCDASKKAYAAVVYVRSQRGDQVLIQQLAAKSRLAPLDKKGNRNSTINRLELMSCVIGARLAVTIKAALDFNKLKSFYWTDSTTALAWIKREEDWGTFVGNRTQEIGKHSHKEEWKYVPGPLNPADLPSRGCSPSQLLESKWWEGPHWLRSNEDDWPSKEISVAEEEVLLEKKRTSISAVMIQTVRRPRFSSYLNNVRVAAYVRRFIDNCRSQTQNRRVGLLVKLDEMKRGERDLLYGLQRQHYPKEPKFKNLDVHLKGNLYHVKTRLLYKNDTELFREPVLLPNEDPLVHQLIDHIHRTNCHAGTQVVLGKLRERYWILKGRKTVSRVLQRCSICRRYSSKSIPCEPAPLPQDRVESQYAFQTTGVDLAGPLILKGGKKAWIVLYTCALYRGVHLDIVDSLSSEEFLDSLEKFTCLVGRPSHIYSDNGTNFVGANHLMERLQWKKLERLLSIKRIRWSFNPPTAAWWGGWWERLIRSVKELLRRMLGTAKLSKKELEKCLLAVAHTLNHRPLTTLTEDSQDLIPLVPAMFMKDLPISGLPEREMVIGHDLQDSYKKVRELKAALTERFRKEYLGNLIQRKAEKGVTPPAVGDVVLVGSDNKKRYEWPLGRITELIAGKDGKVRVAKVKTAHGLLTRPMQRLYPLEVPTSKVFPKSPVPVEAVHQEDPLVVTRSGRRVKKTSRYCQWNY